VPYYPGSTELLEYANDDAIDMRVALMLDPDHWRAENITLLVGDAGTAEAIGAAVRAMGAAAAPGDVCLFFYAGHGGQLPDSAPVDEADGLDEYLSTGTEWVRDDEVAEWFAAFECRNICLVVDSCRAAGVSRSAPSGDGEPEDCAVGIAEDVIRASAPAPGRRAAGDGTGDGPVLLAASSEAGTSYTSPNLGNGVFTFFVAEALWRPETDTDRDGIVSAEEVFAYASPRTREYSPGQTPVLLDLHEGELPLARAATRDFGALEDSAFGGGACDAAPDAGRGGGGQATAIALVLAAVGVAILKQHARAVVASLLAVVFATGCAADVTRSSVPVTGAGGGPGVPVAPRSQRARRKPFARVESVWPVCEKNADYGPGFGAGVFASLGGAGRRWEFGVDTIFVESREVDMAETLLAGRCDVLWHVGPVSASREAYLLTGLRVFHGTASARWGEVWEIAAGARLGVGWRSATSPLDLRVTLDALVGSENARGLLGLAFSFGF
jgi:hypothetical protein